jgi:Na+/H+ antiporter NhaC
MTTADYAPYYVWGYIVPLFTIFCGYTGFGMFYTRGRRGWGKNKSLPDKNEIASALAASRTE